MSSFTDKLVNRLDPSDQISSLFDYQDVVSESEKALTAEKVGRAVSGNLGSNGTDGASLDKFIDATYAAFSEGDAQRWIVISGSSNGNDGFYHVDFVDSATEVTISPDLAAAETGLVWQMYEAPSLESDMHLTITQLRDMIDPGSDWYQNMPRGFNPANTTAGDVKNEKMSLKVLADNWYGSKTKVFRNLIFTAQAAVATDTGKLLTTTVAYATPTDRVGGTAGALPIFASTANTGSYYDEGGINGVVKVNVIDEATGDEFFGAGGSNGRIFAKLEDGADHTGTGDGTDVFVKFYEDDGGSGIAYTWDASDPSTLRYELPRRKNRKDILEHEEDSQFLGSTLGDAETSQDIAQIRDALGIVDGNGSADWNWTNTTNFYCFQSDPATAEAALNDLNDCMGSRDYTAENVVTDGESITASIDALDQAIASGSIKSKIIERVLADIPAGVAHTLPFATGSTPAIVTYKVDTGFRSLYMDLYVGGQKVISDSSGLIMDGQYEETSNTQVTFRFRVKKGQAIEYIIRDDA